MGDNVDLEDRLGVRTPMQWNNTANGGFSVLGTSLYAPVVASALYGCSAVNVESQDKVSSSLLNWMRKLIAVRKQYPAFGHGSITFLQPENRSILAFIRSLDDTHILCIYNLSNSVQSVRLNLEGFAGKHLIDIFDEMAYPVISHKAYISSLQGHEFYWFKIQ